MDNGEGVVVVAAKLSWALKRPFRVLAGVDVGTVTSVTSIHACSLKPPPAAPPFAAEDDCEISWLDDAV
jgi:hypothetical protein